MDNVNAGRRPAAALIGASAVQECSQGEEEEHAVLFSMHHIVTDGWSLQVLLRELTSLYAAGVAGRPSPLTR